MFLSAARHLRCHLVAYLALFVALGGTSYAALRLPAGSVGNRQLKNNAVTSAKVRNRSLKAVDFARGQIPAGATGAQGPKGDRGADGKNGTNGTDGTNGANATNGTNGTNGKTVLNGSGAPDPALGSDGDFYIDTSANAIYGPKSGGNWGSATSLVGPSGATNRTLVKGSAVNVAASGDGEAKATCPSGKTATGGGYDSVSVLQVITSAPTNDSTQSWVIEAHNNSSSVAGQVNAWVVCVSP